MHRDGQQADGIGHREHAVPAGCQPAGQTNIQDKLGSGEQRLIRHSQACLWRPRRATTAVANEAVPLAMSLGLVPASRQRSAASGETRRGVWLTGMRPFLRRLGLPGARDEGIRTFEEPLSGQFQAASEGQFAAPTPASSESFRWRNSSGGCLLAAAGRASRRLRMERTA